MYKQLTAQLRTRLSYAMVKVQKGWETKNINELENLAAQQSSPLSTTASSERQLASPRSKVTASPERAGFLQSNIRTKLSPPRGLGMSGRSSPDNISSSSINFESRLELERHGPTSNLPSKRPSLAPPVDLSPRNIRRSNPASFGPPSLDAKSKNNLSNLSDSSTSSSIRTLVTATPPTVHKPLIHTPSQQNASAMEQDAIETLLFMSSPGNSQYRPSSQPLSGSPFRSIFPSSQTQEKKHELPIPITKIPDIIPNDDAVPISPRKKNFLDDVDLESSENIDRILDQMPTDVDEEEEESSSTSSISIREDDDDIDDIDVDMNLGIGVSVPSVRARNSTTTNTNTTAATVVASR
jgi:hypothetical protein